MDEDLQPPPPAPTPTSPALAPAPAFQPLDPRAIPYEKVNRWIRVGIWSVILLVATTMMFTLGWFAAWLRPVLLTLALLGWGIQLVAAILLPRLHFKHTSYRVDDQGLEIRSGVLWRSIVTVARSRVQHLDVSQGPIERNYGLGRLHVYTAGASDSPVVLWGVAHEQATALRDDLGHWSSDGDGV